VGGYFRLFPVIREQLGKLAKEGAQAVMHTHRRQANMVLLDQDTHGNPGLTIDCLYCGAG